MKDAQKEGVSRLSPEPVSSAEQEARRGNNATLHITLIHPDIPQNLGAVLRLSACFSAQVHVIEPCGFPMDHSKLKRSGMDYIQHTSLITHLSWAHFLAHRANHPGRLLLAETDGSASLYDTGFQHGDYLLFGSEGAGTPREIYTQVDASFHIPMRQGLRSLNVAMSAGIVVAEAWRQLRWAL